MKMSLYMLDGLFDHMADNDKVGLLRKVIDDKLLMNEDVIEQVTQMVDLLSLQVIVQSLFPPPEVGVDKSSARKKTPAKKPTTKKSPPKKAPSPKRASQASKMSRTTASTPQPEQLE